MPGSHYHQPLMPITCSRQDDGLWRMNLLSFILTVLATAASTEDAKADGGKWVHSGSNITLRYDGEENGRYRNLSVMKQGKLVRRIALGKRSYSLFEYDPIRRRPLTAGMCLSLTWNPVRLACRMGAVLCMKGGTAVSSTHEAVACSRVRPGNSVEGNSMTLAPGHLPPFLTCTLLRCVPPRRTMPQAA